MGEYVRVLESGNCFDLPAPLLSFVFMLAGAIPPELGKLGALQKLNLWSNKLSGELSQLKSHKKQSWVPINVSRQRLRGIHACCL